MTSDLRSRLAGLVVLALLGIGVAVIGTTVGATGPLTVPDSGTSLVVSEENVTLEHADNRTTVVDDVSRVESIEIERQDSGTYRVATESSDPLSDADRRLARRLVRENATVQQAFSDLDGYELSVDPIRELTADSTRSTTVHDVTTVSADGDSNDGTGNYTFSIEADDDANVVVVGRDPSVVESRAVVRFQDPTTDEIHGSATVDLANETVASVSSP